MAILGIFLVKMEKKYDLGLIKKFLKPGLFKNIFFENKYIFTFKDNILALLHKKKSFFLNINIFSSKDNILALFYKENVF